MTQHYTDLKFSSAKQVKTQNYNSTDKWHIYSMVKKICSGSRTQLNHDRRFGRVEVHKRGTTKDPRRSRNLCFTRI